MFGKNVRMTFAGLEVESNLPAKKYQDQQKPALNIDFIQQLNAVSTVHSKLSAVHLHHFLCHLHWTCTPLILGKNKKCITCPFLLMSRSRLWVYAQAAIPIQFILQTSSLEIN